MNLPYTLIKTKTQYNAYCKRVEVLLDKKPQTKITRDELELLTLLIEKYDEENNTLAEISDPVEVLKSLMDEANMKAVDLALVLNVSKGLVSDILNNKKGMSKEVIRKLAQYFKIRQEFFNPHLQKHENYSYTAKEKTQVAVAREPKAKYGKRN